MGEEAGVFNGQEGVHKRLWQFVIADIFTIVRTKFHKQIAIRIIDTAAFFTNKVVDIELWHIGCHDFYRDKSDCTNRKIYSQNSTKYCSPLAHSLLLFQKLPARTC